MSIFTAKRLTIITIVYWFLLSYVVAALILWFILLFQQNENIAQLRLQDLKHDDYFYLQKIEKIDEQKNRKTAQYIGEGVTFLGLILIGAVYIYRATRRQFNLSMQQQNFMMAVTHELKTPIAVTRLNLETLQKRKLEEQQQQKLLSNTLQEVNRLNSLCNNILLASQLDAGAYKVSRSDVNVSVLAERVVRDFSTRHTHRVISGSIEENLSINGEELLLEILMTNLVENAVKYSPRDTPVIVSLFKKGNTINFSVADEGPGIAHDEKSRIFDKFYRIGDEATRTAKGTGLGLYLCKKIAKDHHAEIKVDDRVKGTVFTVSFQL
jgi:signal transduction histidine kinase